jgi:hypothetical protein
MAVWLCSSGGVQLSALNDKIWCDNTLDERATLAIRDLQPVIRYLLFPSCRSAPVTKPVVYACVAVCGWCCRLAGLCVCWCLAQGSSTRWSPLSLLHASVASQWMECVCLCAVSSPRKTKEGASETGGSCVSLYHGTCDACRHRRAAAGHVWQQCARVSVSLSC